ncbi:hypothetical protein [Absidia glauca]|uniref:Uncharacterized protein n=1 Tax=Absidia glauca TaxID=4829 RepID=A0A168LG47_ABSGL|nr:hypothetical protein [Absidia glauca]
MAQLSDYGERVIDRINMIGMWLAVVICIRNFFVCFHQYQRTRGKIHLVNISQVVVFFIYRFLYGLIPLFEIATCAYYPLLVSLWHLDYLLFYAVMFMRLLILESDKNSLWIKVVGISLIALRFADWPYELAFLPVEQSILDTSSASGTTCWAIWANGVIILNFIGDALANLFLSGMFVRRLYVHIRRSKKVMSHHNCVIEYIARKSLICLALTFVVNLIMNIFKVTMFLGDRSDAFTVYFAIIESTLLVEALRVDHPGLRDQSTCQQCVHSGYTDLGRNKNKNKKKDEEDGESLPNKDDDDDDIPHIHHIHHPSPEHSQHISLEIIPSRATTSLPKSFKLVNKNLHRHPYHSPTTSSYHQPPVPYLKSIHTVQQTSSAPPFAVPIRPVVRSSGEIEATPTVSLGSIELDSPRWIASSHSGKLD